MTKREWLKIAAAGACGGLLPQPSWSAPAPAEAAPADEPPADAPSSEESECVEDIVTAYKLADWARLMNPPSPFALCIAAEMLGRRQWTFFPAADFPRRFRGPESDLKQDPDVLWTDAERMVEEAVKMAKANKVGVDTVQALAKVILVRARGGLNGPVFYTIKLAAGQTDTYQIKYKKGEWARVAVITPGLTGLSLKVVNDQKEPRGDDRERRPPYIAFVPRKKDGDEFTVTVTNRGKEEVVYHLFTS